jgi:hypothetical protein
MTAASLTRSIARPRGFQFRLATLLIAMTWAGLACAAMAAPTPFWVTVVSTITFFSLLMSVLIIIYRREGLRAFAVGFLVFGGAYGAGVLLFDAPSSGGPGQETILPTTRAIGWLYIQYHTKITRLSPGGGMGGGMGGMGGAPVAVPRYLYQYFYQAAQLVCTMLVGGLGGVIARLLYLTRPEQAFCRDHSPPPTDAP